MRLFEPPAPNLVEFSWNHGRFLDFWSFVHLLSGVLLGMLAWGVSLPLPETIVVIAGLATIYESIEILMQVSEDAENVLMDLILTTIGGVLAWHLLTLFHPGAADAVWTFFGVLMLDLYLFLLGWRHYLGEKIYGR